MRILFIPNHRNGESVKGAQALQAQLDCDSSILEEGSDEESLDLSAYTLAVALGGDGTILKAARLVRGTDIPILGISYGHLGFLAACRSDEGLNAIAKAERSELAQSLRFTLSVDATFEDETISDLFCLNDIAIKQANDRPILSYTISCNDEHIAHISGDGCVVATATGSTAYALSAGGPIVYPEFEGMICAPVAPHTFTSRALVLSPEDRLIINMEDSVKGQCALFRDGQRVRREAPLKAISVCMGEHPIKLLCDPADGFYKRIARVFYRS